VFDAAFTSSDEEAFKILSPDVVRIWQSSAPSDVRVARAIEMPREISSDFREGGRQKEISFELEVDAAPMRATTGLNILPEVTDGWLAEWRSVQYRILAVIWQSGTATLRLGPESDPSGW
jgi:hypothetical protein